MEGQKTKEKGIVVSIVLDRRAVLFRDDHYDSQDCDVGRCVERLK